jgi:hypothetical protein
VEKRFPAWLYENLVENTLPWQEGRVMTLDEFHRQYTLHDSYWIGLFQDIAFGGEVTLAFQWDIFWQTKALQEKNDSVPAAVSEWTFLFLLVSQVDRIDVLGYEPTEVLHQRIVGNAEWQAIDGISVLSVNDVFGGSVSVIYQGELRMLALTTDGKKLEL